MLEDFFKSYQRSQKIRVRVVYAVLIAVIIIGLVRLFMYLAATP
jgi:hypothetical protein